MRYHHQKPDQYSSIYGETYVCDHPVYDVCTLFRIEKYGLAVIQQRYNANTKTTFWTEIDPWLTDVIYLNPNFEKYFESRAKTVTDGLYPTVTIRQIMWGLKIKPLKKEVWETVFDRKDI